LEDGLEDALAIVALPEKHRRRLRSSTNVLERLKEEVRRREWVIFISPNLTIRLRPSTLTILSKAIYSPFGT
jgi:transposase-like protein